jgi:hypothetical protein
MNESNENAAKLFDWFIIIPDERVPLPAQQEMAEHPSQEKPKIKVMPDGTKIRLNSDGS